MSKNNLRKNNENTYRCISNPINSRRSRIIENIERISLNSTTSAPFIHRSRSRDSDTVKSYPSNAKITSSKYNHILCRSSAF